MSAEIRILMLEDSISDAKLVELALRKAVIRFVSERVDTREGFALSLESFKPDIILADYKLPSFDGLSAIKVVQKTHPEIPVIMVSGALGDEGAVEMLHAGAKDYILKDNLARLGPAVLRTLSAEQSIRNRKLAEEKYHALFTMARDGIVLLDCDTGHVLECNPEYERLTGRTMEELKGWRVWELHPMSIKEAGRKKFLEVIQAGLGGSDELPFQKPDGEIVQVEFTASVIQIRDRCLIQGIVRDITERKHAEIELHRMNRALRTISACNQILIHADDEGRLLNDMCRVIVEQTGYLLAWVGFVEYDEQKTVRPVAHAGYKKGYLERARITWGDNEQGCGPTGTAIKTQKPFVVQDAQTDPAYLPWRDNSLKLGYHSILALPLISLGQVFGALNIYSPESNGFLEPEIRLLGELADDLAFGIITLRIRQLQQLGAERLQRSMEGSIAAMAATVEMRDPYTAGHSTGLPHCPGRWLKRLACWRMKSWAFITPR